MELFKVQNIVEFNARFNSDEKCLEYPSHYKWDTDYKCQVRSNYSCTCNLCRDTESPIVNTLFHRVRFGIQKAFFICFKMSNSSKSISASQMALRVDTTEKTTRTFKHKVREAMASSESFPMDGLVQVDEFVVGG